LHPRSRVAAFAHVLATTELNRYIKTENGRLLRNKAEELRALPDEHKKVLIIVLVINKA
jgi:hypothetical protein